MRLVYDPRGFDKVRIGAIILDSKEQLHRLRYTDGLGRAWRMDDGETWTLSDRLDFPVILLTEGEPAVELAEKVDPQSVAHIIGRDGEREGSYIESKPSEDVVHLVGRELPGER